MKLCNIYYSKYLQYMLSLLQTSSQKYNLFLAMFKRTCKIDSKIKYIGILLYRYKMELQKTNYKNDTLKVEINCYIDKKNEIWFRRKEIALILEYKNTCKAIMDHVHKDDKKFMVCKIKPKSGGNKTLPLAEDLEKAIKCLFINESGFYSLILSSKQPKAREFKHWVTSKVLPSIRKKGYYDIKSKKLLIESEYDLHCKVVSFIRDKYSEALMIAGLGENQRTHNMRLSSWRKGYMPGQCDLMLMNPTSKYNSLCIEFKSPTGQYIVSEQQLHMKKMYEKNKCKYIMSNSYDDVIFEIVKHMEESNRYIKRRSATI